MPSIGPMELAIVLVIVLIIFGPRKLPQLGRSLGRGIRELRSSVGGIGEQSGGEREDPAEDAGEAVEGEILEEDRV